MKSPERRAWEKNWNIVQAKIKYFDGVRKKLRKQIADLPRGEEQNTRRRSWAQAIDALEAARREAAALKRTEPPK